MTIEDRARARTKGISLAAKIATVGGIAVAALGIVEARAAASSGKAAASIASEAAADDTAKPNTEGLFKVQSGGCGCSPCWGPPAPPASRTARARSAKRRGAAKTKRKSGGAR